MNSRSLIAITAIVSSCIFTSCNEHVKVKDMADKPSGFGGYESNIEWGEIDSSRLLSGHPADMPDIDVNRKEMEAKGLLLSNDLTSWVGPWGISYTANLTSDASGIGNWQESQFIYAIRNGKLKGLPNGRPLLPPMPWPMIRHMTDDELKAVFAYLQSTVPVKNVVPPPKPPVGN
jgi:hypothetical protein